MSFNISYFTTMIVLEELHAWLSDFFSGIGGSVYLPTFVLQIPPTDMDTDATFTVDFGNTIDFKRIRKVTATIFGDDGVRNEASLTKDGFDSVTWSSASTLITFTRTVGGAFDGANFSSLLIGNRGEVTIWT